jgi:predicted Rossmann fold nucleotide-binding protein DprA/Smf involved in DNA uptake
MAAPGPPAPAGDGAVVWVALASAPLALDELASRTGLPFGRALAALSLLELDGWAVQAAGGRFARRER